MPLMPGSTTSSNARSGFSSATIFSAFSPLLAEKHIVALGLKRAADGPQRQGLVIDNENGMLHGYAITSSVCCTSLPACRMGRVTRTVVP